MNLTEIIATSFNIDMSKIDKISIINNIQNYDMFISCVNKFGIGENNLHIYEDDTNRLHFIQSKDNFRLDVAKVLEYKFIGEFLYQLHTESNTTNLESSKYIATFKKL